MIFLFDMDGVLVNSEPVTTKAAQLVLAKYGADAKAEDFLPFIGAGEERFIAGACEANGIPYQSMMKQETYDLYDQLARDSLEVFPAVVPVLSALKKRGDRLGLASSADRRKICTNLEIAGIPEGTFETVVSGEDVANKKPFPDIYLMAAKRMHVNPEQCIVIEDALNGIEAAHRAGMKAVAVTTSFPKEALGSADWVIEDIGELPALFD